MWRDDQQYPTFCEDIKKEIYPQEVLDLYPNPTVDEFLAVKSWFASKPGMGRTAIGRIVTLYYLITEANL